MPVNSEGFWQPLLSPKQLEIFNTYQRYVLVNGPRRSSKSIGCLHKITRHAWEIPQARIAVFAKTVKSANAGGIWTDLLETVLPEWCASGIGFKILEGPKIDGATRLQYLTVSNAHGGRSRIQLHSLDYDFDIEASIKGMRFSMVYFSELSNFGNRIVFSTSTEQLRMPHLRPEQHQWLADTNPAEDGEESWIFKIWYRERVAEDHPYPQEQAKYQLIECNLDDNPFITDEEKQSIAARYAHDQNLLDRYYYGLWTSRTEAGLFSDVFLPHTHVLGECGRLNEDDWDVILPSDFCSKLISGWDLGSKNHSTHLLEKIGEGNTCVFHILDEVVALNSLLPIWDFTDAVSSRMDVWENFIRDCCHKNPIEWKHWSDMSAFDQFRAALGGYDHTVVATASDGRIMLMAAPKGKGSVFKRIDILHRLLFQNRLFVSARCIYTIRMLGNIKKGKTKLEPVEDSPMRHVFDSLTYALAAECFWELSESWSPKLGPTSKLASVKL